MQNNRDITTIGTTEDCFEAVNSKNLRVLNRKLTRAAIFTFGMTVRGFKAAD